VTTTKDIVLATADRLSMDTLKAQLDQNVTCIAKVSRKPCLQLGNLNQCTIKNFQELPKSLMGRPLTPNYSNFYPVENALLSTLQDKPVPVGL
jgi:hypothetical protein